MSANLQQIWWTSEQRGEEMRKIENGGTHSRRAEGGRSVDARMYIFVPSSTTTGGTTGTRRTPPEGTSVFFIFLDHFFIITVLTTIHEIILALVAYINIHYEK